MRNQAASCLIDVKSQGGRSVKRPEAQVNMQGAAEWADVIGRKDSTSWKASNANNITATDCIAHVHGG